MSIDPITFEWLLSNNSRTHELVEGVYVNKTVDGVEIIPVSAYKASALQDLRRELEGVTITRLGIAPAQDLLILMDGNRTFQNEGRFLKVHIHSMANGGIHPQAQQSPLQVLVTRSQSERIEFNIYSSLLIAGNVVAICFDILWGMGLSKSRAIL
ncbi:hypothetical protein BDN70DRAFT_184338 [Pholiota conissans]|uniref:Uncharacterized protein n=1 Tax=Pholiota conissans TaxID=109636 RepID=A0A9P6CRI8_9AGAR|nr:hypothetical protein BDN70DRAFT_184338 [Pholiota conissans]